LDVREIFLANVKTPIYQEEVEPELPPTDCDDTWGGFRLTNRRKVRMEQELLMRRSACLEPTGRNQKKYQKRIVMLACAEQHGHEDIVLTPSTELEVVQISICPFISIFSGEMSGSVARSAVLRYAYCPSDFYTKRAQLMSKKLLSASHDVVQ
jgi:ribosomal protein S30